MTKIEEINGKMFVDNYNVEDLIKLKETLKNQNSKNYKKSESLFVIYQVLEALYQKYNNYLPKSFLIKFDNFLKETINIINIKKEDD